MGILGKYGTTVRRRKIGPTAILAAAVFALLAVVVVVSLTIRTDRPTTLEGVTAEALVEIDTLAELLPSTANATSTEARTVDTCPDRSGGDEVTIIRTITVAPAFDRSAWLNEASTRYEARGWSTSLRILSDNDHRTLTLVGPLLLIYRVASVAPNGASRLIITTTSRCTAP